MTSRRWSGQLGWVRTPTVDLRELYVASDVATPIPLFEPLDGGGVRAVGSVETVMRAGRQLLGWGRTSLAPGEYDVGLDLSLLAEVEVVHPDTRQAVTPSYDGTVLHLVHGVLVGVTVLGDAERPGRLDLWPGRPVLIEVEP